jgi:phosphate:Na+ symporter
LHVFCRRDTPQHYRVEYSMDYHLFWPVLIRSAKKLSFGKGTFDGDDKDIRHLDPLLLEAPPVALEQCIKELGYMTRLCEKNIQVSFAAFMDGSLKNRAEVEQREETIDKLQTQTTAFLAQLSRLDLSEQVSSAIPDLIHGINDAERLGDHAENLIELTELKLSNKITYSENVRADIKSIFDLIMRQFKAVHRAIDERDPAAVEEALGIESKINAEHEKMAHRNVIRLGDTDVNVLANIIFFDFITNLERMGDRLTNIAERVKLNGE